MTKNASAGAAQHLTKRGVYVDADEILIDQQYPVEGILKDEPKETSALKVHVQGSLYIETDELPYQSVLVYAYGAQRSARTRLV